MTACLPFLELLENPCQVFYWCQVCVPPLCFPVGDIAIFYSPLYSRNRISALGSDGSKKVARMSWLKQGHLRASFRAFLPLPVCQVVCMSLLLESVCSQFIWTWDCLQSWLAPEGRSCNPKQRVVGWPVQPFPPSLLDKFPTRQWLKFSAPGIPVFLWQWVPMSHENKTLFSLKWNLSLLCSSVWAFPYHKKRRHIVSYLSPYLRSITLIWLFFVIDNTSLSSCLL